MADPKRPLADPETFIPGMEFEEDPGVEDEVTAVLEEMLLHD